MPVDCHCVYWGEISTTIETKYPYLWWLLASGVNQKACLLSDMWLLYLFIMSLALLPSLDSPTPSSLLLYLLNVPSYCGSISRFAHQFLCCLHRDMCWHGLCGSVLPVVTLMIGMFVWSAYSSVGSQFVVPCELSWYLCCQRICVYYINSDETIEFCFICRR